MVGREERNSISLYIEKNLQKWWGRWDPCGKARSVVSSPIKDVNVGQGLG